MDQSGSTKVTGQFTASGRSDFAYTYDSQKLRQGQSYETSHGDTTMNLEETRFQVANDYRLPQCDDNEHTFDNNASKIVFDESAGVNSDDLMMMEDELKQVDQSMASNLSQGSSLHINEKAETARNDKAIAQRLYY